MAQDDIAPFSFRRRPRGPTTRITPSRLAALDSAIIEAVREHPGISVRGIELSVRAKGVKHSMSVMGVAIERLITHHRIRRTTTMTPRKRRVLKHYPRDATP